MTGTAAGPDRVRTLIADGAELVRRGIRDVLARDRRFTVVGEIARPQDVVEACLELSPDIIFLGPGRDDEDNRNNAASLTALRQMRRLNPFASVIVLVDGDMVEDLLEPVRAGARAVLLRDAPASALLQAGRDVLAGAAALDPLLTRSLFEYLAAGADLPTAGVPEFRLNPAVLSALSPREQDVLRSLARGCRNKQIAAQLEVSVGTVKTHLRHIFRKLRVADRTATVLYAHQVHLPDAA